MALNRTQLRADNLGVRTTLTCPEPWRISPGPRWPCLPAVIQVLPYRLRLYIQNQTYLDFDELIRVLLVDTLELLEVRFQLLDLILRSLQLSTNSSNLLGRD